MVAGRQQGKSVTAVRWLLEQPRDRVLLTSSRDRRNHLMRMVQRVTNGAGPKDFYEFVATRVVVVGERDLHGRYFAAREIGIDDAEDVLRLLFGAEISLVTMNGTLMPTAHNPPKYNFDGDVVDKELEGRIAIDDGPRLRPVRDNPQA